MCAVVFVHMLLCMNTYVLFVCCLFFKTGVQNEFSPVSAKVLMLSKAVGGSEIYLIAKSRRRLVNG